MKKLFMAMAVVLLSATMFTSCNGNGNDPSSPSKTEPINKQWSYDFQQVQWVETNVLDFSTPGKLTAAYKRSTDSVFTVLYTSSIDSIVYTNDAKTAGVYYSKNKVGNPFSQQFKDITDSIAFFGVGGMFQPYKKSNYKLQ